MLEALITLLIDRERPQTARHTECQSTAVHQVWSGHRSDSEVLRYGAGTATAAAVAVRAQARRGGAAAVAVTAVGVGGERIDLGGPIGERERLLLVAGVTERVEQLTSREHLDPGDAEILVLRPHRQG